MHLTLKKILKKCEKVRIIGKRRVTDDSCELIFSTRNRLEVNQLFCDIFGPSLKPTGKRPTRMDRRLTKDHGGIRIYQKLFAKKFDDATIIAIFRPWRYGIRITVKLVVLKAADLEKPDDGALKKGFLQVLSQTNRAISRLIGKLS